MIIFLIFLSSTPNLMVLVLPYNTITICWDAIIMSNFSVIPNTHIFWLAETNSVDSIVFYLMPGPEISMGRQINRPEQN